MNENYTVMVDASWAQLPVASVFNRWREELNACPQPKTVRLGDLIEQLEEDGFDPKSINVKLTKEMLDLLVFPKAVSSTNPNDASLEVTVEFQAVTPTLEKESVHIDELLVDCSEFEQAGFDILSYTIQTVDGVYTFECKDQTQADFNAFIADKVKGKILNIKETFVNHPTTNYITFTRILDDYFYIEMHFHNGEKL